MAEHGRAGRQVYSSASSSLAQPVRGGRSGLRERLTKEVKHLTDQETGQSGRSTRGPAISSVLVDVEASTHHRVQLGSSPVSAQIESFSSGQERLRWLEVVTDAGLAQLT